MTIIKKISVELLKKTALELNEILEPDPPIKITTRSKADELKAGIVDVSMLLEDGDQLTQETVDVLEILEVDLPAKLKIIRGKSAAKKREPAKVSQKPLLPDELNKAERTKYGSVVGTAHGLLDDLFIKGTSRKQMVELLKKKFPERYGEDEDSLRRLNNIINRHIQDLRLGMRTGGKSIIAVESDIGIITIK